MDMFLKMYNVKMLVPLSVRDGMQTLLQAPVSFSKHNLFAHVQSGCGNLLWLNATLLYPESDKTNKMCQILYLSNSDILSFV